MVRARWITLSIILSFALVQASCAPVSEKANGIGVSVSKKTTNAQGSVLPVVDWTEEVSLPDDTLYVRHQTDSLIFLVSLDNERKVTTLRPISGFSLYLGGVADQIKKFSFSPSLADKTFVLRIPDPLQKNNGDAKLYYSGVCTATTDLRRLYQLGAVFWRPNDNIEALHCYKYILDRNPSSVAARYGTAKVCIDKKDQCAFAYLQSLVASNPEFIEARELTIQNPFRSEKEDATFAADLGKLLDLDIPLAERVSILNSQAFWLERQDKIDDAMRVIKQLNATESELLGIYPSAAFAYYTEAIHAGLLEEAKGAYEDAIASYRIADTVAASDRLVPDSSRYEIDLGLARMLRKSGDTEDSKALCEAWSKRWKKLVTRPAHRPGEFREDGIGEVEGRWEFSCGSPEKGLQLIEDAIKKDPESHTPYTALAQYYYSIGEVEKGRDAEATASRLLQAWEDRWGDQ